MQRANHRVDKQKGTQVHAGHATALVALAALLAGSAAAEARPASHNMRLVGFDDLQARSAYQPIIHQQGGRWIAYVGHHNGEAPNPLEGGNVEPNGVSIVDVTNPRRPVYLKHLLAENGGSQMVQACSGDDLPGTTADDDQHFLLAHERQLRPRDLTRSS